MTFKINPSEAELYFLFSGGGAGGGHRHKALPPLYGNVVQGRFCSCYWDV